MTPTQKDAPNKVVKEIQDMPEEEFKQRLEEHKNSIFNSLFELPTEENHD